MSSEESFAKEQFTIQLYNILIPNIHEGIRSVFRTATEMCARLEEPAKTVMTFQNLLSTIPSWGQEANLDKLEKECERILSTADCEDYIDDLLTAVFTCYLKSLTSGRNTDKPVSIELEIPTFESFVHKVYIHSAREFWKKPLLIKNTTIENNDAAETIIRKCIDDVIRTSIPLKKILKEYFSLTGGGTTTMPSATIEKKVESEPVEQPKVEERVISFDRTVIDVPVAEPEIAPEAEVRRVEFNQPIIHRFEEAEESESETDGAESVVSDITIEELEPKKPGKVRLGEDSDIPLEIDLMDDGLDEGELKVKF